MSGRKGQHELPTSAAVIAAGGVFLPAEVCDPIWRVMREYLAKHERNGGRVRPEVRTALDAMRAAALAHLGTVDLRSSEDAERRTPKIAGLSGQILTTGQMADSLGVTEQHARVLARQAGIAPVSRGRWLAEDVAALEVARR